MPLNRDEAKRLTDVIQSLVTPNGNHQPTREVVARTPEGAKLVRPGADAPAAAPWPPSPSLTGNLDADAHEALYQSFKRRLLTELHDDPVYVRLLANVPSIEVIEETRTVEMDGESLKGRLALMIAHGFFDSAKTQGAARTELKRTGSEPNGGNLSRAFSDFVGDGYLTREGDSFVKNPRLTVNVKRQRLEV